MHSVRGITPEGKKVNIKLRVNKKYERSPTIAEFSEINQSENSHFCKSDAANSSKNRHGVLLFTNCYRDPIRKTSNDRFENYISGWGTVICTDKDSPDFMEGIGRIDIRKGTDEVAELHDKIFTTEDDEQRREYLKELSDHSQIRLPLIIYRYRLIRRFHLSNINDAKEYVKHVTTEILNKNVGCGFAVRLLDKNHQIYKNSYREIFQNFIKDENRLESPDEMVERYFATPHAVSLLEQGDHELEVIPIEKVFSGKKTTRHYLKKNNYKMIRSLYTTSSYGSKVCHIISKPFRFKDEYTGDERLLVDRVFSMSSPIGHPMRLTVDGNCNMTMAGENPNGYDYSSVFKVEFPSKRVELKRNAFIYKFLTSGTVDGFTNKNTSEATNEHDSNGTLAEESFPAIRSDSDDKKELISESLVSDGVTESTNGKDWSSDHVTLDDYPMEKHADFENYKNKADKIERVDEIKLKAEAASETTKDATSVSEIHFDEKVVEELSLPNKAALSKEPDSLEPNEDEGKEQEIFNNSDTDENSLLEDNYESNNSSAIESEIQEESIFVSRDNSPDCEATDLKEDNQNTEENKTEQIDIRDQHYNEEPVIELVIDENETEIESGTPSEINKKDSEADLSINIEDDDISEVGVSDEPIIMYTENEDDEVQERKDVDLQTESDLSQNLEVEVSPSEEVSVSEDDSLKTKDNEENSVNVDENKESDKQVEMKSLQDELKTHRDLSEEKHPSVDKSILNDESIPLSMQDIDNAEQKEPLDEKKDFPLVFDDLEQYESYIASSEDEDNNREKESVLHDDNESNHENEKNIDSGEDNEKSEGSGEETSDDEPTGMAAYLMGFH